MTFLFSELLQILDTTCIPKIPAVALQQWWANLDQASKDLEKTIFRDLSPTPIP